jgi:hypothetical protein
VQRLARGLTAMWQSMQTNSPMMEGCRDVRIIATHRMGGVVVGIPTTGASAK